MPSKVHVRRRQNGSIALIAVAALAVGGLLFAGALAVDLGRIAWEKRRLQSTADLAAMDAVRNVGRCLLTPGDASAAARDSATRNNYSEDAAVAPNVVEYGSVDTVAGIREFTPGANPAQATAVRVRLERSVPRTLLARAFMPGDAELRAEAVAARDVQATLELGSFTGRFDSSTATAFDDLFGEMLDAADLQLDAASYDGLVDADLTLRDLLEAHGSAGSVDELLGIEMSSSEYFSLVADGLSNSGESGAAATVGEFAAEASAPQTITLGDLIEVQPGNEDAALDTVLGAFDLVNIGAQLINGDQVISLDPLSLAIPGVSSADLAVKIISAPSISVGPPGQDEQGEWFTEARTGQSRMQLGLNLPGDEALGLAEVRLEIFGETAQSRAWLAAADCADRQDPVHELLVGVEPGVASFGIGHFSEIGNSSALEESLTAQVVPLGPPPIGLGGHVVSIARVTASGEVSFSNPPEDRTFRGPFPPAAAASSKQTVGTDLSDAVANALGSLLSETFFEIELEGEDPLPLAESEIVDGLRQQIEGVLVELGAGEVLASLLDSLGIRLGGADVSIANFYAEDAQPRLVR